MKWCCRGYRKWACDTFFFHGHFILREDSRWALLSPLVATIAVPLLFRINSPPSSDQSHNHVLLAFPCKKNVLLEACGWDQFTQAIRELFDAYLSRNHVIENKNATSCRVIRIKMANLPQTTKLSFTLLKIWWDSNWNLSPTQIH